MNDRNGQIKRGRKWEYTIIRYLYNKKEVWY